MKPVFENKLIENEVEWMSSYQDGNSLGVTRLLYTESWSKLHNDLNQKLQNMNLTTYTDGIGNLFARIEGSESPLAVIATGSHMDTVVEGGRLDGQFGIIAGYLAIDYLIKNYGQPKKTLELFVMAEEEGSRFPYAFWGSKSIFGLSKRSEVEGTKDLDGLKFEDEMRRCGYEFKIDETTFRDDIEAFIEVHIEQGNTLENLNKSIGIVDNIVGQKRFTVTLDGEANHAGTTLMQYRKDTVRCFSEFAQKAFETCDRYGNPLVLTFGRLNLEPNTVNVVPGKAKFSIDMRHTSQDVLNNFEMEVIKLLEDTASKYEIGCTTDKWMDAAPVAMNQSIINLLDESCKDLGLDYIQMHSGAGHDSQIIAKFAPTAMIFTSSIKGISHNPAEETPIKDLNQAVVLLTHALYKLAY